MTIRTNPQCHNTSGYRGVSRVNSSINPWRAQTMFNGETYHLGCFPTAHEAHEAYKKAVSQLRGEDYPDD